jgi:predicted lipid-binding transport protein (Tim44 family)
MSGIRGVLVGVLWGCLIGAVMLWTIGGAALLTFLWLFAATWRTLFRNFAPSRRDDPAVFQAQHSSSHG